VRTDRSQAQVDFMSEESEFVHDLHDKQVLLIHTTQQDLNHHKPYHHLLTPQMATPIGLVDPSLSKICPFSIINETAISTYIYE